MAGSRENSKNNNFFIFPNCFKLIICYKDRIFIGNFQVLYSKIDMKLFIFGLKVVENKDDCTNWLNHHLIF